MPDPIGPQAFLNLCEMSIDNKYELEALGELLQEKGIVREGIGLGKSASPESLGEQSEI